MTQRRSGDILFGHALSALREAGRTGIAAIIGGHSHKKKMV